MGRVILIVVLLILVVGMLPIFPYSQNFGYYPSGGLGLALIIVILALLFGKGTRANL